MISNLINYLLQVQNTHYALSLTSLQNIKSNHFPKQNISTESCYNNSTL